MRELDEKIDELVKGTASRFEKLEKLIFNEVMNYLSDRVQVREQRITFDAQNYGVISSIDSLLSRFSSAIQNIGKYIIRGIGSVMGLTTDQLSKIDVRAIKTGATVTDELLRHSATVINKNLTLEPLFLDIKQQAIALMADPKGIDLVELRRALRSKVVDNRLAQRYFSRWTHDLYSQMQRVGANRIRLDLGLKYAVYQGGLIKTSRDFCEERNGKCFSDDEIMKWESLNWEGKPETGYNALIDCGGYNCRHRLDWVSDQMARRLRPDLFKNKVEEQSTSIDDFKDFDNIDTAKDYIKSKGVEQINMGKADLTHYNTVARALSVIPKSAIPDVIGDKSLYETISGIKIKRKSDEWLGISLDWQIFDRSKMDYVRKKIIAINSNFKNIYDISLKKIKYNDLYSKQMNGRKWYFNTFNGSTHYHEMGHIFDKTKKISIKKDWIDIANKWHNESKIDMIKVSKGGDFSGENGSEAFAEAFASFYGNKSNGLPNYIIDYFIKNVN